MAVRSGLTRKDGKKKWKKKTKKQRGKKINKKAKKNKEGRKQPTSKQRRNGVLSSHQSEWGFTVKQGATTIHEDTASCTVSTSSLTMEVEAVTHAIHWIASRGDSQTKHAIILTDSMSLLQQQKMKSGMRSPDWNVSMVDIHLRKLL